MKKQVLLLILMLLPMLASAYDAYIDGIYYYFSGDEATVTYRDEHFKSYSGTIVIPENVIYNDISYRVTSIGSRAFSLCRNLTSVTIGNSVNSIGHYAFEYCDKLTSITIGNGIMSIGFDAFNGCGSLTKVIVSDISAWCGCSISSGGNPLYYANHLYSDEETEITDLVIPEGVTRIGGSAFYNCSGLSSVTISNSVTSIGDSAFYGCSNLISVIIGSGVLSIGNDAFSGISVKKVIWLTNTPPSGYTNVNGIKNYASNNQYSNLASVSIYPFLSSMFEVNGIRYVPVSPSERTCDAIDCAYNESAENINIGESVTNKGISLTVKQIGSYFCYGNPYIKNVNLSFRSDIATCAFSYCKNLRLATISNQGSIGDSAFSGCISLQTAELGQGITSIGGSAFQGCSILESVIIPDAVNSIGNNAFEDCSTMTSAKIGNSVQTIGSYAFSGCSSLTNMQIGTGVTSIDAFAFQNCSSLPTIQIPQNVTSIGNYVFSNCYGLKTVLMDDGESELNLGSNNSNPLFINCRLDSVYIGRNIAYPTASNKGYSPFYNNKSLRTIIITDKETEITESEFNSCSALQTVELGEGIKSIGNSAFKNCSKLQSIVIHDSVASLGNNTFENCSAMTFAKIGTSVKSIPTYAFSNCSSLPIIQIPQNVTTIGDHVFNGCISLKTVLMDEGEGELSLGCNGGTPLFVNCPLDSVYIGRNITYSTASSKGYSPFYRNTSLRSVAITDRETEISMNEFYGCTSLKNVRIGDSVTTIGDWAFSGCSSLDYFSFGSNVETIGKEAFSDCTAMTSLISRAETPPVCGSQALDDINKWECTLLVPDGFVEAYQAAPQWKEFFFVDVDPDGIEEIKNESLTPALSKGEGDWYSLDGRKMVNGKLSNGKLPRGINIIRYADGTSKKVLIK